MGSYTVSATVPADIHSPVPQGVHDVARSHVDLYVPGSSAHSTAVPPPLAL